MTSQLYSGAGNRFLLSDNREFHVDVGQVPELCERLKIDGVILLEPSTVADACMRIINRDGSEAEMCGNGLRCLIDFLKELGIVKPFYSVETLAGEHKGWVSQGGVSVQSPRPSDLQLHIAENIHFLNTGVPHAVIFLPEIESVDVAYQGRTLRNSPLFAPAGANVNFASCQQDGTIKIRTYERGVEAETLACGTGVTATALIAHKLFDLPSPITVQVQSGDKLKISFNQDWSEIILEGPVQKVEIP